MNLWRRFCEELLLIQSDFGEIKFPGGGQNEGEDDFQTLIRETLEETGYHIMPEFTHEFGEVEEKRLSLYKPSLMCCVNLLNRSISLVYRQG